VLRFATAIGLRRLMAQDLEEALPLGGVGRELRTAPATGIAGLVFATLFITSLLLLRHHPASGSSPSEIADWYLQRNVRRLSVVGLYLAPFSGIAFLWFIAAIRGRIGAREDRFFATVFLGSGLLFVAMLFAGTAALGASLAAIKFQSAPAPSPDIVVYSRGLAYSLIFVYGIRAAAVFMISVSTIGLRTGALPRWLVVSGYVIAIVLLLSVSFYQLVVLVFPVWVIGVSLVILLSKRDRADSPHRA
jgi:type IV secretory pathway TrbD component